MSAIRRAGMLAASGAAVLAFATACGSSGHSSSSSPTPAPSTTAPATPQPSSPAQPSAPATGAALKVATDAKLGQIVTDSNGFTLYRFDHDTANTTTSACTGSCAELWPAATAPSQPTGSGVNSSMIGTITRADGTKQLTLNGWPLYRYAPDAKPGDTKGQGFSGIWWAVTPTGGKAMASSTSPSTVPSTPSSPSSGNGYGY